LKEAGANDSDDPVEALSAIAGSLAIGLMLDMGADEGAEIADPGPNAYDSLAWRQVQSRLAQEIERLPGPQGIVIRQHYLNGLAFAQVAELLGVSRSRVSQLHHAALTRLRKRIAKEY
jgi:RNA polymerase sigma factor for flagellar operon FliA